MQSNLELFIIKVCRWRKDEEACRAGGGDVEVGRGEKERERTQILKNLSSW